MIARVSLLLIASLLFASAWTYDTRYQGQKSQEVSVVSAHPVRQRWMSAVPGRGFDEPILLQAMRPSNEFRGCFDPSAAYSLEQRPVNTIGYGVKRTQIDEIPMDSLWMFGDSDVTLPRDIVAGSYRAVNNRGEVRNIELDDEKLAYHGILAGAPRRDLYVMDDNNSRWYFIRQQPVSRLELARKPAANARTQRHVHFPSWTKRVAAALDVVMANLFGTVGAQTVDQVSIAQGWAWDQWQMFATNWNALLRQTQSWAENTADWIHAPYHNIEPASRLATRPGSDSRQ